ncbi:MAG: ATP-binding protein [Pseudomonadota bacterium]
MNARPQDLGSQQGLASPKTLLRGRIDGTEPAVRHTLTRLQRETDALGLPTERWSEIVIVLGEVLNNIVEHALAGRKDGWIDVVITLRDGRLFAQTRDDGRPLPLALLTHGTLPDNSGPVEDLPEGGFGWFIIHSLAKDMTYERDDGLNRLSFNLAAR